MTWSFSIGHLFGSELRVHATFFLLLAWIGAAAWIVGGPLAAAVNIAFILVLFACVVAHEFGHALMARRYGIKTPDITLLPIGGLARLERMPEKPGQEIMVALAGPAVNVVIWAVLVFVVGVDTSVDALLAIEDPREGFSPGSRWSTCFWFCSTCCRPFRWMAGGCSARSWPRRCRAPGQPGSPRAAGRSWPSCSAFWA
jgi:Zn-dependent protease